MRLKKSSSLINNKLSVLIFFLCASFLYFLFFTKLDLYGKKCVKLVGDDKSSCILDQVQKYLNKKDIKNALNYVYNFQLKDETFYATDCHGVVHYIGDKAYDLYKNGDKLTFGKESSICSYGFFHAFTSLFVLEGKTEEAGEFCSTLESKSWDSAISCYHGIGHGAIFDFYEYGNKNPKDIIKKGVNLCTTTLKNTYAIDECVSGVYDGIGDVVLDPEFANLTPEDIYSYCNNQPLRYEPSCYENVSHLVFRKTQFGFKKLVGFVMASNLPRKIDAIAGLATIYIVDLKGEDVNLGIEICNDLPLEIKNRCFERMATKYLIDTLEDKYQSAIWFCSRNSFDEEGKSLCFTFALNYLKTYYPRNELIKYCNKEKDKIYKTVCNQL